jgi:hypothetical protein
LAGMRTASWPHHGRAFAYAQALAVSNTAKRNYARHADAGGFSFTHAAQSDEYADAFGKPVRQSVINGSNAVHEHG